MLLGLYLCSQYKPSLYTRYRSFYRKVGLATEGAQAGANAKFLIVINEMAIKCLSKMIIDPERKTQALELVEQIKQVWDPYLMARVELRIFGEYCCHKSYYAIH